MDDFINGYKYDNKKFVNDNLILNKSNTFAQN